MKKTLMTILAHPDDEAYSIGGTLAKYSAEGCDVHIVIATDGAAGTSVDEINFPGKSLSEIRKLEMEASAHLIGAHLHWLGYKDSGMRGDPGNLDSACLIQANKEKTVSQVIQLLTEYKPQVIITHDENGGYFHPDHIYCYQIATQAFLRLQESKSEYKPSDLYYHVLPKWWVLLYAFGMIIGGNNPRKWGRGRDIDVTKAGTPAKKINSTIDIRNYWRLKREACAQHVSQGGDKYIYFHPLLPEWLQKLIFGVEFYVRFNFSNKQTAKSTDLFK
jgi:LmbE family N-acetylglucosaminyl deacetylase